MKIEKGRSAGMNGRQLIKGHGPHGRDQLFVPSKDDRALVLTSASQHRDTVTGYADSSHEFFRNFSPQLHSPIRIRIELSKRTRIANRIPVEIIFTRFFVDLFLKNCETGRDALSRS